MPLQQVVTPKEKAISLYSGLLLRKKKLLALQWVATPKEKTNATRYSKRKSECHCHCNSGWTTWPPPGLTLALPLDSVSHSSLLAHQPALTQSLPRPSVRHAHPAQPLPPSRSPPKKGRQPLLDPSDLPPQAQPRRCAPPPSTRRVSPQNPPPRAF